MTAGRFIQAATFINRLDKYTAPVGLRFSSAVLSSEPVGIFRRRAPCRRHPRMAFFLFLAEVSLFPSHGRAVRAEAQPRMFCLMSRNLDNGISWRPDCCWSAWIGGFAQSGVSFNDPSATTTGRAPRLSHRQRPTSAAPSI